MTQPVTAPYTVSRPRYMPFVGPLLPMMTDPLTLCMNLSRGYGDIITFNIMGQQAVQLNHPDLIRYVLVENHKNYIKSKPYIRFQSALGLGLLTSNGEKWKRDRQKIQPMFNREKIASYYYDIVNKVTEKYKQNWLQATAQGELELDLNEAMEKITTEVVLRSIYGEDIDDETISSLHHSYSVLVDYLGTMRLFPNIDFRRLLGHPASFRFKNALANVDGYLQRLAGQYQRSGPMDRHNLLALLIEARKDDPANFTDTDIRDHCATMVFAAFETSTILMQWFWYMIDDRDDVRLKLKEEITRSAPCTATSDSSKLSFAEVQQMTYLPMVLKETMRLYPPFWLSGREPVEDDVIGGFPVKKGTAVVLPQLAMQRHAKWWDQPNSCIPERFSSENEPNIHEGLYFPFSLGPRRCSGQSFAEMEAKTIISKLLPLFHITVLNKVGNPMKPGISLKLRDHLKVRISRAH